MNRCNFVIHPTCAEGSPGSVIECMNQGLIPIVSREAAIDVDGFGILLDQCSIEEIVRVVRDVSQRPPEWCEDMSARTRDVAIAQFSETAFHRNMSEAIQHIVDWRRQK